MSKRLLKRHKRQVSRAKAKVRLSEPDLRTPEQVRAAREASRPSGARRNELVPLYSTGSGGNSAMRGLDWGETVAKDKETI
jgi:hypothetical protein